MTFSALSFFALLVLLIGSAPAAAADPMASLVIAENWSEIDRVANERLRTDPADSVALHALGRRAIDSEAGSASLRRSLLPRLESCVAAKPADALCQLGYGQVLGVELTSESELAAFSSVGKVQDAFEAAVLADPRNYEARESLVNFYLQAPGIAGGSVEKARQNAGAYGAIDGARAKLLYALIDLNDSDPAKAAAELSAIPPTVSDVDLQRLRAKSWLSVGLARVEAKQYAEARTAFAFSLAAGAPSVVARAHRELGQIALALHDDPGSASDPINDAPARPKTGDAH